MGNTVSCDTEPWELDELNPKSGQAHTLDGAAATSLNFWRVCQRRDEGVVTEAVSIFDLKAFDPRDCYLVIQTINLSKDDSQQKSSATGGKSDRGRTVTQLLTSSMEAFTPRGLAGSFSAFEPPVFAHPRLIAFESGGNGKGLGHAVYVWNGQNAMSVTKATALTKGFEVSRMLLGSGQVQSALLRQLHCGSMVPPLLTRITRRNSKLLSPAVSDDISDKLYDDVSGHVHPSFIELYQHNHLFRTVSAEAAGWSDRGKTDPAARSNLKDRNDAPQFEGLKQTLAEVLKHTSAFDESDRPGDYGESGYESESDDDDDDDEPAQQQPSAASAKPAFSLKMPGTKPGAPAAGNGGAGFSIPAISGLSDSRPTSTSNPVPETPRLPTETPRIGIPSMPETGRDTSRSQGFSLGAKLPTSGDTEELSENALRRQKLAQNDITCSRINDLISMGADTVARDKELLLENNITNVLNCAGIECENYHEDTFKYKRFWLSDVPGEDISSEFWRAIDYFQQVDQEGGRLFVHCWQGVSRSATLIIAYLMWKNGWTCEKAMAHVKERRSVTHPNAGFHVQLLNWGKQLANPNDRPALRTYRVGKGAKWIPAGNAVTRAVKDAAADPTQWDAESCYVVHTESDIYVWEGCFSDRYPHHLAAALDFVPLLQKYEGAPSRVTRVRHGREPEMFVATVGQPVDADSVQAPASEDDPPPPQHSRGPSTQAVVSNEPRGPSGPKPQLFAYPDWEDYGVFDSDDISDEDDGVFVLASNNDQGLIYVWIGAEVDLEDATVREFGNEMAEGWAEAVGRKLGPVEVVEQDDEPDDFWDCFANG